MPKRNLSPAEIELVRQDMDEFFSPEATAERRRQIEAEIDRECEEAERGEDDEEE